MKEYLTVLKKYAEFNGRARRREYWMFFLFNFIIAIVLSVLEGLVGSPGIVSLLYCLGVLVPSLAVAIRRLHDIDKSGWWLFIGLVPIIGGIWLLVLMVLDSKAGENRFGSNPKTVAA